MLLDEPIYTVPEASREARLSTWTIWDLLKQGKLTRTKVAGQDVCPPVRTSRARHRYGEPETDCSPPI